MPRKTFNNLLDKFKAENKWIKEHPIRGYFITAYRYIRSFIYNSPDLPSDLYRKIKRGVQRAYYGYSSEDYWCIHSYHSKVVYGLLRDLKKYKHGIPLIVFSKNALVDEIGNFTDKAELEAKRKWDKILDQMIYAYKLNCDIASGDREVYSKNYNTEQIKEFNVLSLKEEHDRVRGMNLFNKYYLSLWD
jgi:hypothetical protein